MCRRRRRGQQLRQRQAAVVGCLQVRVRVRKRVRVRERAKEKVMVEGVMQTRKALCSPHRTVIMAEIPPVSTTAGHN